MRKSESERDIELLAILAVLTATTQSLADRRGGVRG
jgi:hypothetical protein